MKRDGYFIDCTLGYGGHSKAILENFQNIKLIGIDRDDEALEFSKTALEKFQDRILFHRGTFATILPSLKEEPIVGILADFGLSSLQLDRKERGFSFHSNTLDMRMDRRTTLTAHSVVNHYSRDRLEYILKNYGEVHLYKKVADAIIEARGRKTIESAKELSDIISKILPKSGKIAPATLTFQAIRIEVNSELEEIKRLLDTIEMKGRKGELKGTIVTLITFHSLEDRAVKQKYMSWSKKCICESSAIRCSCGKNHELGRVIVKKPITASKHELRINSRARSAKLRSFIFKG